jgi:hypothetical protein
LPSRRAACLGGALAISGLALWRTGAWRIVGHWFRPPLSVAGIVWQVDNATADIAGDWQKLGADQLLIQWSTVDGVDFLTDAAAGKPDWWRISRQPWARQVILGLAGDFDEKTARANALKLAQNAARIADQPGPLNVTGYYFPVEVDPTWREAPEIMTKALALLPRPLWISVYDSANIGARPLTNWLAGWLPHDVGIFFQDGVGVEARTPPVARHYADVMAASLGRGRVRVIVEAFRPLTGGKFRPATVDELLPQIVAMQGYEIFLFDGPHYLGRGEVDELARRMNRS